jgi:hypothetical protein
MLSKPLPPRRRSKNALRYDGLKLGEAKSSVIWKIILCDFWGDILRPPVTPCLRSNANAQA